MPYQKNSRQIAPTSLCLSGLKSSFWAPGKRKKSRKPLKLHIRFRLKWMRQNETKKGFGPIFSSRNLIWG